MRKVIFVVLMTILGFGVVWCGTHRTFTGNGWWMERVNPQEGPVPAAVVPRMDNGEGYNVWDDIMSDGSWDGPLVPIGPIPLPWHKTYRRENAHWISWRNDGTDTIGPTTYYWYYSPQFRIPNNLSRATLWFSVDDNLLYLRLRKISTGQTWLRTVNKTGYARFHRIDLTDFFRLHADGATYQLEFLVRNTAASYTGLVAYMSYDYGLAQTYTYNFPSGWGWRTISMPFFPTTPYPTLRTFFTNATQARTYNWETGGVDTIPVDAVLEGWVGDKVRTYTFQIYTNQPSPVTISGYPICEQRYLDINNNNYLWFGTVNCNVPFSGTNPDDYPDGKILGTLTWQYSDADGGGESWPTVTVYPRYGYITDPVELPNSLPYHLDLSCSGGLMAGGEEELVEPVYFGHTEEEIKEIEELLSTIEIEALDTTDIMAYIRELQERTLMSSNPNGRYLDDPIFHKGASQQTEIPSGFSMSAYPTPFNSTVAITVNVPEDCRVDISVYDVSGKFVCNLFNGELSTGRFNFIWDGTDNRDASMPAGVYFIKVCSSNYDAAVKVMLVK